jgi:hypothetical protein
MDDKKIEDAVFKKAMEFFKDYAVEFFGIDTRVIAPAETEIKNIDIKTNITDYLFYTDDGNYLHFEFQTTEKKEDILRFLYYDASLMYNKKRKVRTIVVYSADITDAVTNIDMGTIKYEVQAFYMKDLNGDERLKTVEDKIINRQKLLPEDMLNLSFVPLMRGSENTSLRTLKSIELANKIENKDDKIQCLTLLYALLEKFGDELAKKRFKEVFSMTEIGKMIREEGKNEGKLEGKAEILIKLLTKKFKVVPENYKQKIKTLPDETIDIIAIDIFEINSLDEIEKYF